MFQIYEGFVHSYPPSHLFFFKLDSHFVEKIYRITVICSSQIFIHPCRKKRVVYVFLPLGYTWKIGILEASICSGLISKPCVEKLDVERVGLQKRLYKSGLLVELKIILLLHFWSKLCRKDFGGCPLQNAAHGSRDELQRIIDNSFSKLAKIGLHFASQLVQNPIAG